HAAHAAQLDGGGVGLDEERSGLRPAVDEQRPVTRDSNLLRREPIDRRTAKQQEALDGGVPEELLPRLLLARAGRSQEVDRAEVRVVDPAQIGRQRAAEASARPRVERGRARRERAAGGDRREEDERGRRLPEREERCENR